MMSKGEFEGVFTIVGLLGKTHPSIAIIQPLLDKYQSEESYNGTDPEGEARGLREALELIKEVGGVMPNVQAHLSKLDQRTARPPVEEPRPEEVAPSESPEPAGAGEFRIDYEAQTEVDD